MIDKTCLGYDVVIALMMYTISPIVLHIYLLFHVVYITTGASLFSLATVVAIPVSSAMSFLIMVLFRGLYHFWCHSYKKSK